MQVTIVLSGAPGAGKTVIAEFIKRQLGIHLGIDAEVSRGSERTGLAHDTVVVQTTPEILAQIANHR